MKTARVLLLSPSGNAKAGSMSHRTGSPPAIDDGVGRATRLGFQLARGQRPVQRTDVMLDEHEHEHGHKQVHAPAVVQHDVTSALPSSMASITEATTLRCSAKRSGRLTVASASSASAAQPKVGPATQP